MVDEEKTVGVKGFMPKSVQYAEKIDGDFAHGIAEFYSSVWADRENGLSKKNKHFVAFGIACATLNIDSAVKILSRIKKFGGTRQEINDTMMIAAWVGGIQKFTDFSKAVLKEMDRLEL